MKSTGHLAQDSKSWDWSPREYVDHFSTGSYSFAGGCCTVKLQSTDLNGSFLKLVLACNYHVSVFVCVCVRVRVCVWGGVGKGGGR
jgi:hypothetical protein